MSSRTKFEQQYDQEAKLIYSLIVAGKSANFADAALRKLLKAIAMATGNDQTKILPFAMIRMLTQSRLNEGLLMARTGNYTKLTKALWDIVHSDIDLSTCKPEDLEKFHGFGPKTSRFCIMWIRPEEHYAALDVHILRWLGILGHKVPRQTPQSRKAYSGLERIFLREAIKRGKTPRQLDEEIWIAGAGRTQKTPLPECK